MVTCMWGRKQILSRQARWTKFCVYTSNRQLFALHSWHYGSGTWRAFDSSYKQPFHWNNGELRFYKNFKDEINSSYLNIPFQTIRCRLEGAPPKGHKWSGEATEAFRELVGENDMVNLRVIREDGDCPYVELNMPESNDGSINFDLSTEFDIFP